MPADKGMGKSLMLRLLAERMREEHKLPESARTGTKAYDESLVESLAEAWHYLDHWAIHGEAQFAVNALAERQAQQAVAGHVPLTTSAGRRCLSIAGRCRPPPASTTLFRRRTGIRPWAFPTWN